MRAIVAIPCYNCAPQLPRVLDGVDERLLTRVEEFWVVDNRSSDDTAEVALRYKESGRIPSLRVFRNDRNVNLGGTHKIVFSAAAEAGFTHVVILHGDDQASTAEVHDLLDVAADPARPDTVLGSRFDRRSRLHGYDRKRIAGNRVLNALYSVVAGRRLQDLGSGLNVFAVRDLDPRTYRTFADALTFNFELILDLVRRRVRFQFLPITWRETDQVSNARNVQVFTGALKILTRWRLHRRRPVDPAAPYTWTELGE